MQKAACLHQSTLDSIFMFIYNSNFLIDACFSHYFFLLTLGII